MVAKDIRSGAVVAYRFIRYETVETYRQIKESIEAGGFHIRAVTLDGRRGIRELFDSLPVQMCHFHQQAILTRYLTRKPKHPAAQKLKEIAATLGRVSRCRFQWMLSAWYQRYEAYLCEKTYNEANGKWHYTHRRLRSAYRSLNNNLPYLFTYKEYSELNIPNTTNALDGGLFSPLKARLKIHGGIHENLKKKLIVFSLQNHGK